MFFCTADSTLLMAGSWWVDEVGAAVREAVRGGRQATAVYLGAANGDVPEYFDLFRFGANRLGLADGDCVHARASSSAADLELVANGAALVLLAGGDPHAGLAAARACGMDAALRSAAEGGAVLVGISAGAIMLGTHAYHVPDEPSYALPSPALGLLPFVFGAHEEDADWASLLAALYALRITLERDVPPGLALPFGSAVGVHPDGTLRVAPLVKPPSHAVGTRPCPFLAASPSPAPAAAQPEAGAPAWRGGGRGGEGGQSQLALEHGSSWRVVRTGSGDGARLEPLEPGPCPGGARADVEEMAALAPI